MYNNDENEQLIFHIYGPHCEKNSILGWGGGGGSFNNHNWSILLLINPLTNINLHVTYESNLIISSKNTKYNYFFHFWGSPGEAFVASRATKGSVNEDFITVETHVQGNQLRASFSYLGHNVKKYIFSYCVLVTSVSLQPV